MRQGVPHGQDPLEDGMEPWTQSSMVSTEWQLGTALGDAMFGAASRSVRGGAGS